VNPRIEERGVRGHEPPGSLVRSQLERLLGSEIFLRSERLSGFLRFVVERTLDGQGGSLKEQILGSELYGKGPEFDGSADPIVRVDARRLRDKLREYYSQFPRDPIVISLPKGSYVPVFQENELLLDTRAPAQSANVNQAPRLQWRRRAASIGIAAVLVVIGVARFMWSGRSQQLSRAVLITSFPGNKVAPAISPNARYLAFSSKGPENSGAADIWIKSIETGALRRLTETPQLTETSPAWSPNGQEIAFVRVGQGVFIIPSSGGIERRVSKSGTYIDWTSDGKSVLIRDRVRDGPYGIYQVFIDTQERRCLTQPLVGDGDWRFSVSPDGAKVAFIRIEHPGSGDIYVVPMQGGEPRRITNWNA
jgi:WD40-like Beta Propeller Repeat